MSDRRAIIHIGTWKTGSTSIQTLLLSRRKMLLRQGACLPASNGGGRCQLLMYYAIGGRYVANQPCWNGLAPTVRLEQFAREFAAEMDQLPETVDRVIFSEENLSSNMRNVEEIGRLRAFLNPYFSRFSVVLYVRRQDLFLASLYVQMLRGGYLGSPLGPYTLKRVKQQGDYHLLVSQWAEVFGAESICLRIYESGVKPYDSVQDFLTLCGLAMPHNRPPVVRTNISINLVGQQILRDVGSRIFSQDADLRTLSGQWDRLVKIIERKHSGKGWLPTRSEGAAIVNQFAAGNEALRRRYFPERESLFSPDFSALPEQAGMPTDSDLFAGSSAVLAELISENVTPVVLAHDGIAQYRRWQKAAEEAGKNKTRPALGDAATP